jgi:hypothetical protein
MFYFLLKPFIGPTQANYQHAPIVFAEGLQQHKIKFSANINYYPDPSGNFLFLKTDTPPPDTIYIVTAHPEDFKEEMAAFNDTRKYDIIIFDSKDEWVRPQSTSLLQYAHRYFMTSTKVVTDRIKPLCFAASNRMITIIQSQPKISWSDRQETIFWAHRVTNHQLRNIVKDVYDKQGISYTKYLDNFESPEDPEALHWWTQTGRRHQPQYFAELQKYKYMDAHGGYLNREGGIVQWDSWKVWEGLLSGMLVLTADLDFYNIKLPCKLIPYVHYIPVRYNHIPDAYANLARLTDEKKMQIALQGQQLALQNFNPKSMAKYILDQLK